MRKTKRITTAKELDKFPSAIPTVYAGIKLKSRLEAQCAYLLDILGWNWAYEPQSYMLRNGVAYTPDFVVRDLELVIECRGYETDRGSAQIEGFTAEFDQHGFRFFLLIGPGATSLTWGMPGLGRVSTIGAVCYCRTCSGFRLSQHDACQSCFEHAYCDYRLQIKEGRISVLGSASDKWTDLLAAPGCEFASKLAQFSDILRCADRSDIQRAYFQCDIDRSDLCVRRGVIPLETWRDVISITAILIPSLRMGE